MRDEVKGSISNAFGFATEQAVWQRRFWEQQLMNEADFVRHVGQHEGDWRLNHCYCQSGVFSLQSHNRCTEIALETGFCKKWLSQFKGSHPKQAIVRQTRTGLRIHASRFKHPFHLIRLSQIDRRRVRFWNI